MHTPNDKGVVAVRDRCGSSHFHNSSADELGAPNSGCLMLP